jgi:hypothetical protein
VSWPIASGKLGFFVPMSPRWGIAALGYAAFEGALGAAAFSAEDAKPLVEVAAFVLLLPGLVVTLAVIYLVGALAWNVRDTMASRPMWPVTATLSALFVVAAVANVVLIWLVVSVMLRRRSNARTDEPGQAREQGATDPASL